MLCIWTRYQESKYTSLAFHFYWLEKQKSIALVSSVLPLFFFIYFPFLSSRWNQHYKALFSLSLPPLYVDIYNQFSLFSCEHYKLYIQIFILLSSIQVFCFFLLESLPVFSFKLIWFCYGLSLYSFFSSSLFQCAFLQ